MIELEVVTAAQIQAIDITDLISQHLQRDDGFLWISVPHTTAALILCEADSKMLADIETTARRLLAPLEPFTHDKNDNPNGGAHLFSSLMGTQLILRISSRRLAVGTYQRVILLELDGPRTRSVQLASLRSGAEDGGAV